MCLPRHDRTRQDKTRQEKIGEDKATQDNTFDYGMERKLDGLPDRVGGGGKTNT